MEEGVDFLLVMGGVVSGLMLIGGDVLFWLTSWNSVTAMASDSVSIVERYFVVEEDGLRKLVQKDPVTVRSCFVTSRFTFNSQSDSLVLKEAIANV